MTRNDLILKRREVVEQIDGLRKKRDALDEVLAMFPEESPMLEGMPTGKYAGATVAFAVRDLLFSNPETFFTASEIATRVKREGIQSESPNFVTIISSTCARLVEKEGVTSKEVDGRKQYGVTMAAAILNS